MDKRTRVLICIGAATAANCEPCFEHFYGNAQELGLDQACTVSRDDRDVLVCVPR